MKEIWLLGSIGPWTLGTGTDAFPGADAPAGDGARTPSGRNEATPTTTARNDARARPTPVAVRPLACAAVCRAGHRVNPGRTSRAKASTCGRPAPGQLHTR